jgi:FlaA1/EpsC-like NDP-sugar epimerase
VVTGQRPGERLYEELLGPHDRRVAGPEPGLVRVDDLEVISHVARVDAAVEELALLQREGRSDALREAAMCIAGDLQ